MSEATKKNLQFPTADVIASLFFWGDAVKIVTTNKKIGRQSPMHVGRLKMPSE